LCFFGFTSTKVAKPTQQNNNNFFTNTKKQIKHSHQLLLQNTWRQQVEEKRMSCGVGIFAGCYKDGKELNRFGKKNQEIDNPRLRFVVMALEPCMMRNKPMRRSLAHCCCGPCLCNSRREKTKMMKNAALLVVLALSPVGLGKNN
jgi:hypothetical protein